MFSALANDLVDIDQVRLMTTRDCRLPALDFSNIDVHTINEGEDWELRLCELLDLADMFWPIAPETDGILEKLCQLCESRKCMLLNSSSEAVHCATSKRLTVDLLQRVGLPCVKTWNATDDWFNQMDKDTKVVIKPDDGIACENIRVTDVVRAHDMIRDGDVVQPYVEGDAASLSVLYSGGKYRLAAVNLQEVKYHEDARSGKFSLKACIVNGLRNKSYDFDTMAKKIAQGIPGLAGYVGIDCIVRGEEIFIIEVNPRVTTSYVGLRRSIHVNPALCVISLLTQAPLPHFDIETAVTVKVEL